MKSQSGARVIERDGRRPDNRLIAAALLLAMACATPAARPATASGGQNVVIDVPGSATSRLVIRNDPDAASVLLAVPAGRTWAALSTAYSALNIPIVGFDSTTHTITGATSAFREFLRSPVSRFVDCGSTLVGPNADTHRVELRIQSRVAAESDTSSTVSTRLDATGTGSVGTVNCATTGSLEKIVNDQVTALLEKAQ